MRRDQRVGGQPGEMVVMEAGGQTVFQQGGMASNSKAGAERTEKMQLESVPRSFCSLHSVLACGLHLLADFPTYLPSDSGQPHLGSQGPTRCISRLGLRFRQEWSSSPFQPEGWC